LGWERTLGLRQTFGEGPILLATPGQPQLRPNAQ